MPRSVENPFKEKRLPKWIYYVSIGFVSLMLYLFIFGATNNSTTNSSSFFTSTGDSVRRRTNYNRNGDVIETKNNNNNERNAIPGDIQIDRLKQLNSGDNDDDRSVEDEESSDESPDYQTENEEEIRSGDDRMEVDVDNNDGDSESESESGDEHENENDDDGGSNSNEDEEEEEDEFPLLETQDEYLRWLRVYYQALKFDKNENSMNKQKQLTQSILSESLQLGCDYIAANQKVDKGNFNYQYNFVTKEMDHSDSPVRQAGALWGMTLCFQSHPTNMKYKRAVERGIQFFQKHMVDGPASIRDGHDSDSDSRMIKYPHFDESQSGVNALYGLSIIDYIRTMHDNKIKQDDGDDEDSSKIIINIKDLKIQLKGTINFLTYMQNDDLHFSSGYNLLKGTKSDQSSPYYDGEIMLCLVKAAKYMNGYDTTLIPIIEQVAPILAQAYTVDAWRNDEHDSDKTKGFYQWSSMFFSEYYLAKWNNYEFYGDYVIVLAHWIIHTHGILQRNRNTGYAFEGIISAYEIAKIRRHDDALSDFEYIIDEGLYNLGRWQVNGPLSSTNEYLVKHPTDENIAIGGVMNAINQAPLRIDTTQHQMHAVKMALATIYKE